MKIIVILSLFLLTSCGSMLTPKADLKKVKQIEKLASSYSFKKVKTLRATNKMLRPLRKGQWVVSLTEDTKSGEKSLLIRKIVSVRKHTVTLETETYSSSKKDPLRRTVVQQVIKGYPRSFAVNGKASFASLLSKFEIISMKIKDGDQPVQDLSSTAASPMAKLGIKGLAGEIKFGKVSKKSCKSKYIKSSKCYYVPYTMGMMGFNISGSYVQNSRVPIVGYLTTESEQLRETVLSYGFKGKKVIIK